MNEAPVVRWCSLTPEKAVHGLLPESGFLCLRRLMNCLYLPSPARPAGLSNYSPLISGYYF
jgi:hypothetical protein